MLRQKEGGGIGVADVSSGTDIDFATVGLERRGSVVTGIGNRISPWLDKNDTYRKENSNPLCNRTSCWQSKVDMRKAV